jgi:hypothetical protein
MTTQTLPRPIAAAHAWRGPEMAARQDWIRPLTGDEIAALDAEVRRLDASGIDIAAIGPADMPVPALAGLIAEIRRQVLQAHGFILLRGLPVERWTTRQTAIAYFGLGTHLGEPVSQNGKGHILGHVKDIGMDYASPVHRGYQTAARLPYHTDSADVVGLLCLRPAKAGGSPPSPARRPSTTPCWSAGRICWPSWCARSIATAAAKCPPAPRNGTLCPSSTPCPAAG